MKRGRTSQTLTERLRRLLAHERKLVRRVARLRRTIGNVLRRLRQRGVPSIYVARATASAFGRTLDVEDLQLVQTVLRARLKRARRGADKTGERQPP